MATKRLAFITGASSFTGAHIVPAFKRAGFEVHVTSSSEVSSYDEIKKQRLAYADPDFVHEKLEFGSVAFIEKLKELKPSIFVNHGAWMEGYRKPDFNYQLAFSKGTQSAQEVFHALSASGCDRVIHTGSFFEPGQGDPALGAESPAVSIYGVTKLTVWQVMKFWANQFVLPISKIVIPNPIGPFENSDRLAPLFVRKWKDGQVPDLSVCSAMRDNLPVSWLAKVYVQEALREDGLSITRRPSGFISRQDEFVRMFATQMAKYLKIVTPVNYCEKTQDRLMIRVNAEPVDELANESLVKQFWADWAASFS